MSASIRTYAHTTYARHPYTYLFLRTTTQLICYRAHTRSRHFEDMSARHDILPTSAFLDDKNRRHVFADMSPTLPTCLPDTTCRPFWGASRHDTTPTFPTKVPSFEFETQKWEMRNNNVSLGLLKIICSMKNYFKFKYKIISFLKLGMNHGIRQIWG